MKTYKILLILITILGLSSPLFSQMWIVQHSGLPASANPTLIFSPVNPNVCWGIQRDVLDPKFVLTTNGGTNWSLLGLKGISGFYAQSIAAISADTAWITLDDPSGVKQGGIYKTTNGGADWTRQESAFSGTGSHPKSICFFDSKNGLCHGDPKNGYWEIYTTTDGGTNWTRVPSANIPAPTSGDFSFGLVKKNVGNSYWFSTLNRSAYKTTDRGLTWSVVRNLPTSGGAGNDLAFKDEMNGLAICYFGQRINKLAATSDGGVTWKLLSTAPVYPSAYFFEYVPGTSGTYVVISDNNIGAPEPTVPGSAYTTDNGQSWTVIDKLPHGIPSFTTGNVGWSAGTGDIIYKWVIETHTDIIPVGSTVKKLSSDQFAWARGAVWYNDSILLFTDDFQSGTDIYQFDPISKQISKWPSNSPHCSGLSVDKEGNLIGASFDVIMINKAGKVIKTLASTYNYKRFDNPIDLIADKKGGIYFSDPDFFLTTFPQDKTAVYYIDSIGNVKRVIDDLAEPNGLVLSPDGTKLYVLDSSNKYVYSWDVAPDGSVSGKLSMAELQTKTPGGEGAGAVGMAIDRYGNIYVATEIGIQVFSPQGTAITTIEVPEPPNDCDFGGKDFKTLYITAVTYLNSKFSSNLYSIDLNYPGYAVSRKNGTDAVKTISYQPSVKVYPNPASDYLYVQHNLGKVNSIDILSIDGKKEIISLRKQEETGIEINTQQLKSGMYILRITYPEGIVTKKFVKK